MLHRRGFLPTLLLPFLACLLWIPFLIPFLKSERFSHFGYVLLTPHTFPRRPDTLPERPKARLNICVSSPSLSLTSRVSEPSVFTWKTPQNHHRLEAIAPSVTDPTFLRYSDSKQKLTLLDLPLHPAEGTRTVPISHPASFNLTCIHTLSRRLWLRASYFLPANRTTL